MRVSIKTISILFLLVPVATQAAELAEVKAPVAYPVNMLWVYVFFGVLMSGMLVSLARLYRELKKKYEHDKKLPPAWETAYRRLEELHQRYQGSPQDVKAFYDTLCDILRRYCEQQFDIKASEMTSQEFLEDIQKRNIFFQEPQALFRKFLDSCDMVKFAKYAPAASESQESFALAKRIIDLTRPPEKVK